jgi:hypothetical protein
MADLGIYAKTPPIFRCRRHRRNAQQHLACAYRQPFGAGGRRPNERIGVDGAVIRALEYAFGHHSRVGLATGGRLILEKMAPVAISHPRLPGGSPLGKRI